MVGFRQLHWLACCIAINSSLKPPHCLRLELRLCAAPRPAPPPRVLQVDEKVFKNIELFKRENASGKRECKASRGRWPMLC